ncbi:MAG: hypothetical protein CL691_00330 [Cellvibrionales bacterium]|nr:hypothetical protein [Cellvibrionales bacterium]
MLHLMKQIRRKFLQAKKKSSPTFVELFICGMMGRFSRKKQTELFYETATLKKKKTQKHFKKTCLDWDLGLALPSEQPQSSLPLKRLKDLSSSKPDKT